MWLRHVIDSWASSIHVEHFFALEVVVINNQLTYLEVILLQIYLIENYNQNALILLLLDIKSQIFCAKNIKIIAILLANGFLIKLFTIIHILDCDSNLIFFI